MSNRTGWGRSRPVAIVAALALLGAVALGGLGGGGGRAAAQDETAGTPAPTPLPATVYVNGHGAVIVPPDTASVVVGVDVIRPTLDAAQTEETQQATEIIDAVKAAGIAEDDIQTANFSVNIIRDFDEQGNPTTIQGYQITNQVSVTIRDPDEVGTILEAVVAAGANNIYGISFFAEDPTAAAPQARDAAVRHARGRAEQLAAAAGMSLGRVVSISETASPPPAPVAYGGADAVAESRAAVPIQTGTSEVTVDVQMTFELEEVAS